MITQAQFDEIKPGQLINVQTYSSNGNVCILRSLNIGEYTLLGEVTLEVAARYSVDLIIVLIAADKYNNGSKWNTLGTAAISKMNLDQKNLPFDSIKFKWIDLTREAIVSIQPGNIKPQSKDSAPIPCAECKQFYPYAIANLGEQLVCWGCRDSMGWKYGKNELGQVYLK